MRRLLARPETPELCRAIEDGRLSLRNNDELSRLKRGRVLLFGSFVLGDRLAKLARMYPIKRFRKADLKPIIGSVFDDHPHPSRRLENRPMAAKQLANSRETKDLADTVLHGQTGGGPQKPKRRDFDELSRVAYCGLEGFKQRNPEIAKGKRHDLARNERLD